MCGNPFSPFKKGEKWAKIDAVREPRQRCMQVKTEMKREYHNLLPAVCTLIEVAGVQWMESATLERGFSIRSLTKTGQRYSLGDLSTCCFHDDRHEWTWYSSSARSENPNCGICQGVEELQKKRIPSRNSAVVTRPSRSAQGASNIYSQLSGLEDVVFNDFIKDDWHYLLKAGWDYDF